MEVWGFCLPETSVEKGVLDAGAAVCPNGGGSLMESCVQQQP